MYMNIDLLSTKSLEHDTIHVYVVSPAIYTYSLTSYTLKKHICHYKDMNAFKTENIEKAFRLDSIHKIIDRHFIFCITSNFLVKNPCGWALQKNVD